LEVERIHLRLATGGDEQMRSFEPALPSLLLDGQRDTGAVRLGSADLRFLMNLDPFRRETAEQRARQLRVIALAASTTVTAAPSRR
jgi:hypothetical protein